MGKITAAITGVGLYLPDYILTNEGPHAYTSPRAHRKENRYGCRTLF